MERLLQVCELIQRERINCQSFSKYEVSLQTYCLNYWKRKSKLITQKLEVLTRHTLLGLSRLKDFGRMFPLPGPFTSHLLFFISGMPILYTNITLLGPVSHFNNVIYLFIFIYMSFLIFYSPLRVVIVVHWLFYLHTRTLMPSNPE